MPLLAMLVVMVMVVIVVVVSVAAAVQVRAVRVAVLVFVAVPRQAVSAALARIGRPQIVALADPRSAHAGGRAVVERSLDPLLAERPGRAVIVRFPVRPFHAPREIARPHRHAARGCPLVVRRAPPAER